MHNNHLIQNAQILVLQFLMSIKVGVRVRPFNKREQQLGCRLCVGMQDKTTFLYDPDGGQKKFHYDYSFWSHDKFTIDPDGINVPVDQKYDDQRKVFNAIGSDILTNAWQGYNCCLFAYGQTGSGKSYSMIGYGQNQGIIPIVCDQIFKKIESNTEKNVSFEVTVSMMEIYNQAIRDLLTKKQNSDLKICEHKQLGVYVQGLQKHSVKSFKEIEKRIEEGSQNRSIAATLMNQSSSRSHTIVSINFVQKLEITRSNMSLKYSVIHLVDLAGSESVGKTGVSNKDRLRQTAKINQSLSTLGRVIEILAENSGKMDKAHVPYRDSKLTFILRNALGGNSQTAMICAISPADDNYEQTLSTLRYANRAKKIQNKAIINESDVDKLIRHLREQNQMLKKMLKDVKWNKNYIIQENVINMQTMMEQFGITPNQEELLLENQDTQETSKSSGNEQNGESILLDYSMQKEEQVVDEKAPYITNISQDQLLTRRVKYNCKNLVIGNKSGNPKPDVVLVALGILPQHAKIWTEEGSKSVFIEPLQEGASQYIYLNGNNVTKKEQLFNLDRIIFGSGCVFLVIIFEGEPRTDIEPKDIDYSYAISQMNIPGSSKSVIEQGEMRKQILQQIEAQYEQKKKENQQKLKREMQEQQSIYQRQLQKIQLAKRQQAENLKKQLQAKSEQSNKLQEQKRRILEEIEKFKTLESQLKKQKLEKQAYENTVHALEQKMKMVEQLEEQLKEVHQKQNLMKQQIEKKEENVRKQLQINTVVCTNQNIMNQYKLQMSKKAKNAKELRELFIKRQKIQLQKQLVALVPMVEKFNLIAKQMNRKIESGLSVQYKYISETEISEVLKTATYKGKYKIIIHVLNYEERRGYYWDVETFKNRYSLAQQYFQLFITDPKNQKLGDRNADPFWDPDDPVHFGSAFLSLEALLYGFSFEGKISFIKKGKALGSIQVKVYPCDSNGTEKSFDKMQKNEIQNPRDLLQKNLYFTLQMRNPELKKTYRKLFIQYEIVEDNYKNVKYQTQEFQQHELVYKKFHTIKQLSQNTILNMSEKPIVFALKGLEKPLKLRQEGQLTERSDASSIAQSPNQRQTELFDSPSSKKISNFSIGASNGKSIKIGDKQKGFVFQNSEVMQKIDRQYNQQKSSLILANKNKVQSKKSILKPKDKDCVIY